MSKKIEYVVIAYWGIYDDYNENVEGVFTTKKLAEDYINKQKKSTIKYKIQEVKVNQS